MVAHKQSTVEGQTVSKCKGSTPYILNALVDEGRRLQEDFLKQYSVLRISGEEYADEIVCCTPAFTFWKTT
jgi:hypothetical protein